MFLNLNEFLQETFKSNIYREPFESQVSLIREYFQDGVVDDTAIVVYVDRIFQLYEVHNTTFKNILYETINWPELHKVVYDLDREIKTQLILKK